MKDEINKSYDGNKLEVTEQSIRNILTKRYDKDYDFIRKILFLMCIDWIDVLMAINYQEDHCFSKDIGLDETGRKI